MIKQQFVLLCLLCSSFLLSAQYNRKDSLRGGDRLERACFDVLFYNLSVQFELKDSSIAGSNLIRFKVLYRTKVIQIDLFSHLKIDSILWKDQVLKYKRIDDAVFISFPSFLPVNSTQEVLFYYHGVPNQAKHAPWDGGFVWSKDEQGRVFAGVACEGLGASSWWPNKDQLLDKPDSMLLNFMVPIGLQCVSNGIPVFAKPSKDTNKTHFQWRVTYPILNYNVTFYLGNFQEITDWYVSHGDSLLLSYYVMDYNVEKAEKHFEQVKPMLATYELLFGKYPFWDDGYKLVEAPYLGMEHQSAIAYGNKYQNGYLGRQMKGVDFDYVILHETGHEYWGNSVSMADLADMWIHEAFCTYTEALYVEQHYDYKTMVNYLVQGSKNIQNDHPIIPAHQVNAMGSMDMYAKGAVVLHLIREQLNNDSLWFDSMRSFQEKFAYQSIGSEAAIDFIQSKTGKRIAPLLTHYLKSTELPILRLKKTKGKNTYSVRWINVPSGFEMTVVFESKKGNQKVKIGTENEVKVIPGVRKKKPNIVNLFNLFKVEYE